jgi:hypothetical protein
MHTNQHWKFGKVSFHFTVGLFSSLSSSLLRKRHKDSTEGQDSVAVLDGKRQKHNLQVFIFLKSGT